MSSGDQAAHRARFEWGPAGLEALAGVDVVVVVDVLSFSTAVDVAVSVGAVVHPVAWRDDHDRVDAAPLGTHVAVGRHEVDADHPFSLSPLTLTRLNPGDRLSLPSPNGAALSLAAAERAPTVVTACLRNAAVVGAALAGSDGPVAVVAAGERWPDGGLRPAAEDLLGAGAVLAALDPRELSPEAELAAAAFWAAEGQLERLLLGCASGRELRESGFAADVHVAAMLDASDAVPVLEDGGFRAAALRSTG